MSDSLQYYASPGVMTDPGDWKHLLEEIPDDIGELCRVVQGLLIHVFWAERYGIELPEVRKEEVGIRGVADKLARLRELDARPLTEVRPLERRLVGNCRDFSVMLTAMLRHQGRPARARCGFGAYFLPGRYEDHWVCEVWDVDQERWMLVDAQLDEFQCEALHIAFDPLDVPRDQFIVGGKAWQLCRSGMADPDAFGIFDMHGLWFVRGDFVRDVAALNKVELLPWDGWGIIEGQDEDLSMDDLAFLDRVAELTCADVPEFAAVRDLYESDARLTVPPVVHSYTDGGAQTVILAI
jgi:hypothetical protein